MIRTIQFLWKNNPLPLIISIALILRLIAAILSQGYGMHDDHFLVIETAQSWLEGASYNNWFLERGSGKDPAILNFFYTGLHFLFFKFLHLLGIDDPRMKMLLVRVIHAFWSLITVYIGYHITRVISNEKTARFTALLLAVLWLMPFFSVRNLVEFSCIPFLMLGFWHLMKEPGKDLKASTLILSGLMFGFAFSMRLQTIFFAGGAGLVLLFQKKWKQAFLVGAGFVIMPLLLYGVADWIIWGEPFKEFKVYITHNIEHRFDYTVAPWYNYVLVLAGVLIPPISFFLLFGLVRTWKKMAIIFVPVILFLVFHSAFPNKQERFILPALPFVIMLGMVGWDDFITSRKLSSGWKKAISYSWKFFWVINTILLVLFTTMYSKKARVESMVYLSKYHPIQELVVEESESGHATMLPLFYLEQWPEVIQISHEHPFDEFSAFVRTGQCGQCGFVLFFGNEDMDERLERMKEYLPDLVLEAVIKPSLVDRIFQQLNPVNANRPVFIYRNKDVFPHKID